MLSITKIFHFESAHAISNHPGKCRNVHGHSYELRVSVAAKELNQNDMVMDFYDLKVLVKREVVDKLDHALLLCSNGELAEEFRHHSGRMIWTDKEPTAEHMLEMIMAWIQPGLPSHIQLKQLQLWETTSSFAQWEPA